MTKQEAFDIMMTGLAHQEWERSTATSKNLAFFGFAMWGEKCAYRGKYGRRCPVGHLIPDEKYSESTFECHPVSDLVDELPEELRPLVDFLKRVQDVHDAAIHDDMKENYIEFVAAENDEYGPMEGSITFNGSLYEKGSEHE